jgi:hypothetical protein
MHYLIDSRLDMFSMVAKKAVEQQQQQAQSMNEKRRIILTFSLLSHRKKKKKIEFHASSANAQVAFLFSCFPGCFVACCCQNAH